MSVAAQSFALELDLKKLAEEIARHGYDILRADQVIYYSNFDNRLEALIDWPSCHDPSHPPGELVRWSVKYLKPRFDNHPTDQAHRNLLVVPLISTQNRVLGVIEARNKRTGGAFTEQDLRVATCLARVASSSVDRASLFYRIEDWKQSIETLLSFNATVNQHLEPAEMVRELVANVTGFLNADGGAAGLVIFEDDQRFSVADSFIYDGQCHPMPRRWKPNEGIPGIVLETEFPLLISDYQNNSLADPELVKRFDIGSCICVPIKNAKEEVLGFFKLHRRIGESEFTWQDAAFLESLGNTAAVAIENAQLVRSLEIKNQQIKGLSQHHVRRLEQERQHIARELHDQTGQVLVGLKLQLQLLSGMLSEEQQEAKRELAALRSQLQTAASQLKDLAKKLRPPTLDELGFEASLRQLVSDYRHKVPFEIQVQFESASRLENDTETALFRIAQEGLTNIIKHAQASRVEIRFGLVDRQRQLLIRDNGIGFDSEDVGAGLGLIGMKERVKMFGGSIEVDSNPGSGTTIRVLLPETP